MSSFSWDRFCNFFFQKTSSTLIPQKLNQQSINSNAWMISDFQLRWILDERDQQGGVLPDIMELLNFQLHSSPLLLFFSDDFTLSNSHGLIVILFPLAYFFLEGASVLNFVMHFCRNLSNPLQFALIFLVDSFSKRIYQNLSIVSIVSNLRSVFA